MSYKKNTSIVWFRNNLRVEDNSALYNAVNQSDRVIGYVNIDPNNFKYTEYGFKKTEKFRAKFLLESISDLKQNLNNLNISLIIDYNVYHFHPGGKDTLRRLLGSDPSLIPPLCVRELAPPLPHASTRLGQAISAGG